MIGRIALTLLLATGVPALASAQVDSQGIACNPAGSQIELNACAAQALAAADAELNASWRQVLQQLGDNTVAVDRLKAAQRLWIQLRDADLAAQFPLAEGQDPRVEYGSMLPMSRDHAKAELTRQRTAYLRAHFLADVPY